MDRPTIRGLADTARVARLATVRPDGRPHLVPICFALLGDTAYSAVDHKPKQAGRRLRRIANIEATRAVCLLIDGYAEDWSTLWWVRLDGTGRVLAPGPVDPAAEATRAMAALVAKYPQYTADPPDGPIIAYDIDTWTGWSAT